MSGSTTFRDYQVARLLDSGWATCGSVRRAVEDAMLPAVDRDLLDTFSDRQWKRAEVAVAALERHFADVRFAGQATYGVLLVPDPGRLDTALPVDPEVRRDQLGRATPDVYDERLPSGSRLPTDGAAWTMLAGVTGSYGIAMGSYLDVTRAPASAFTVEGQDTRTLMTRQVWGARVLQAGATPPDCEHNERWTFTLFAGEPLTGGCAESGTVLNGRVRFRLGKPDRGIGPARVAPAVRCE